MMTLPQMICGRPKIEISYDVSNRATLSCLLYNRPIKNRFLKIIGVYRRQVDSLSASFSIENICKSKAEVTNIIARIDTAHDVPKVSVSLPASDIPANIDLIMGANNGTAKTIAHYEPKNIDLTTGEYRVIIRIKASEKEGKYSRKFTVGWHAPTKDTTSYVRVKDSLASGAGGR